MLFTFIESFASWFSGLLNLLYSIKFSLKPNNNSKVINDKYKLKDKEVISHLEAENNYLESWFDSGAALRDKLFDEIVDRIPKKEDSVPIRLKSYEYFRRAAQAGNFLLRLRAPKSSSVYWLSYRVESNQGLSEAGHIYLKNGRFGPYLQYETIPQENIEPVKKKKK